mgnify:CR=1 FL=1|tara:strand:- start:949 stop:1386 length:438 start_codon:yes stop_codon:yes gene_type:complete
MIALIQRVQRASVEVNNCPIGEINKGMLILLGVEKTDSMETVERLAQKVLNYRMFSDENGKMNLNVQQSDGQILVVSQFTLVADTQKGNRPGFSRGASPQWGEECYNAFVKALKEKGASVQTGQFGADMQVSLVNDGPVTFQLQI